MEQFALQLRCNCDRLVSKMATLSIGAIATLDAFEKSTPTIWGTLCPCQSPSARRNGALSSYGTLLIASRRKLGEPSAETTFRGMVNVLASLGVLLVVIPIDFLSLMIVVLGCTSQKSHKTQYLETCFIDGDSLKRRASVLFRSTTSLWCTPQLKDRLWTT